MGSPSDLREPNFDTLPPYVNFSAEEKDDRPARMGVRLAAGFIIAGLFLFIKQSLAAVSEIWEAHQQNQRAAQDRLLSIEPETVDDVLSATDHFEGVAPLAPDMPDAPEFVDSGLSQAFTGRGSAFDPDDMSTGKTAPLLRPQNDNIAPEKSGSINPFLTADAELTVLPSIAKSGGSGGGSAQVSGDSLVFDADDKDDDDTGYDNGDRDPYDPYDPDNTNRAPVVLGPVTLQSRFINQTTTLFAVQLLLLAADADGDDLVVTNLAASSGTLFQTGDGEWEFRPDVHFTGDVTFTYDVSDGIANVGQTALLRIGDVPGVELTGTPNTDSLVGSAGGDAIIALAGNDIVNARAGDDLVRGGDGDDRIVGGDGDDTLYGDDGDDIIFAGDGNDVVFGGKGDDTIFGEDGDDTLLGEQGDDYISGGDGDDIVIGGDDNDELAGDAGADFIDGGDGRDTIRGGSGDDIILSGGGEDDADGGDGDDSFLVQSGDDDDTYDGGAGSDTYDLSLTESDAVANLATNSANSADGGSDTITNFENVVGSQGDDLIIGDGAGNELAGEGGNDEIYAGAGDDVIDAGAGDDIAEGGEGDDKFFATVGDGDDIYDGGAGSDTFDLSQTTSGAAVDLDSGTATSSDSGTDTLIDFENVIGSQGDDDISGDASDNELFGCAGDDEISAGGGDDVISGGIGSDTVSAGTGDDRIIAEDSDGDDHYDGGDGYDTYDYSNATSGAFVDLENSIAISSDGSHDEINNFESVLGGQGEDDLHGNAADNGLSGGDGDDEVASGDGNDVVLGGYGSDTLYGDDGDDLLFGDNGNDRLEGDDGDDLIIGNLGNDRLRGDDGDDALFGGSGNDRLRGEDGDDLLFGGSGDDNLKGGDGDDTLVGESGNDFGRGGDGDDLFIATTGDGDDQYYGEAGNDTYDFSRTSADAVVDLAAGTAISFDIGSDQIIGFETISAGSGNDTLMASSDTEVFIGGAGNDTFVFRSAEEAGLHHNNRDRIEDFEIGDTVDVSFIDADEDMDGNQDFDFVLDTNGQIDRASLVMRYEFDEDDPEAINTILAGYANDDQIADFEICLRGRHDFDSININGAHAALSA